MNISPINLQEQQNTSFQGIIKRGYMPKDMWDLIRKSEELGKIAANKDIVVRGNSRRVLVPDSLHPFMSRKYKLTFSVLKENSIKDKILDFFNLKYRHSMSHYYHSEGGTIMRLCGNHFESLVNRLKKHV